RSTRSSRRGSSTPPTSGCRSPTWSSAPASSAVRRRPSVLELWEPQGALEALERWLADELRDGLVADVYLGYRLAETLRRTPSPAPPEPCPLPALAAQVRGSAPRAARSGWARGSRPGATPGTRRR